MPVLALLKVASIFAVKWVAPLGLIMYISRPKKENPTISAIKALQEAEQAKNQALETAKNARDLADLIKRNADLERELMHVRQGEADRATARAAEEIERMRVQMGEASVAARRAEELAQAAADAALEDAERFAQEAQEERERAEKFHEDAQKEIDAMRKKAETAQKAADEQRHAAKARMARAEEMARAAAEEARKACAAKTEVEERLKKGIQPVLIPTPEELAATKARVQYREDCFHFAIAGVSGSGKSSLVNAFRGLRSSDPGAAVVGVTETTFQTMRYQDANPGSPVIWYDIPGAGPLKCRDWQYFNDQGLYVFDCIIVLFDNRFTMTDVAILTNARRFNIPTYIVRSKADQHIRNVMGEMGYESDEDDTDVERRVKLSMAARQHLIDKTRKSVQVNLEDAQLPDQRVYIVSSDTLLSVILNKTAKKAIDESDLVRDLVNEASARRKEVPVAE